MTLSIGMYSFSKLFAIALLSHNMISCDASDKPDNVDPDGRVGLKGRVVEDGKDFKVIVSFFQIF